MDERTYLRVKVKSLAAEAKVIRQEEKSRCNSSSIRNGLYRHRIDIVRHEARHTLLAYCFLRGTEYIKIEAMAKDKPNWAKVRKMVEKYGAHLAPWLVKTETYDVYQARVLEYKKHLEETLKRFDEWIKHEEAN